MLSGTDQTDTLGPRELYFQAFNGWVALPVAGYDYNSDWTPLLAELSPARMAASLAALEPDVRISRILRGAVHTTAGFTLHAGAALARSKAANPRGGCQSHALSPTLVRGLSLPAPVGPLTSGRQRACADDDGCDVTGAGLCAGSVAGRGGAADSL